MKTKWMAGFLLSLLIAAPAIASEQVLPSTSTLKITIVENDAFEQFTYYNPKHFAYMKNHRKYTGAQAETAMYNLLAKLNLSENASIEELVHQLQKYGFSDLTRVEIRWLKENHQLHTWVWDAED